MHRPTEGRHLADKRSPVTASRAAHFLRLSRNPRETFHTPRPSANASRLVHFLRIARGRLA